MNNETMKQELREAITAGERALTSLHEAQKKLDSAKNWGIFDLLGGGTVSAIIKHSKISDASGYMEDAKYHLQTFQKELRDVNNAMNLNLDIGGFLSFADFFFDGLIADYLVQSKISEAREQVSDAIYQVEEVLSGLRARYENYR